MTTLTFKKLKTPQSQYPAYSVTVVWEPNENIGYFAHVSWGVKTLKNGNRKLVITDCGLEAEVIERWKDNILTQRLTATELKTVLVK